MVLDLTTVGKIEKYLNRYSNNLPYHNPQHCLNVYNRVLEHEDFFFLPKDVSLALEISALFHDAGCRLENSERKNLETAIKLMRECKEVRGIPENILAISSSLILSTDSTRLGERFISFNSDFEQLASDILRDSDITETLDREWALKLYKEFGKTHHYMLDVTFFKYHIPFTDYTRKRVVEVFPELEQVYTERVTGSKIEYHLEDSIYQAFANLKRYERLGYSDEVMDNSSSHLLNMLKIKEKLGFK